MCEEMAVDRETAVGAEASVGTAVGAKAAVDKEVVGREATVP